MWRASCYGSSRVAAFLQKELIVNDRAKQFLPPGERRMTFHLPVAPKTAWTIVAMVVAVMVVSGLSYWDAQREAIAGLDDFADQQATLARSLGIALHFQLDALGSEKSRQGKQIDGDRGLSALIPGVSGLERRAGVLLLVLPPGSDSFFTVDGVRVFSSELKAAIEQGKTSIRLPREQAARLGLPERTAMAGLDTLDAGSSGHWGIAAVATAERLRDREYRSQWRLVLSILVAGGLVLVFGGFALHRQRQEFELSHALSLADAQSALDERLARANRAATLGTMAMGIAHEIGTPLGIIAGRAEQLLQPPVNEKKIERNAKAIIEQTDGIGKIIRAFLLLARGDSKSSQTVEPTEIVRSAKGLVSHVFAKAGVALDDDLAHDLPPLHGDARLLEHALVNLLLNACHACLRGGRVEIGTRRHGSFIQFIVVDDGCGISPTDASRVTEPFFTTKPAGVGTGLGLAIVTEIIKSHHGKLSLSPHSPRGTRAVVEIPLQPGGTHETT